MTPLFFGSSDRRLFGVYDPPQERDRRRAVVICNAIGRDYYHAHRGCRVLARQLSAAGLHALRFDYLGTGDSTGEVPDFLIEDWLQNIGEAADELKDMADARKVALVGLRLGATLAAVAAESRSDIDRLVLWDPIDDFDACLDVLDELPPSMIEELRAISPKQLQPALPRRLLLTTTSAGSSSLSSRWCGGGDDATTIRTCPGPSVWASEGDFGSAGIPVDALKTMTEWLAEPT